MVEGVSLKRLLGSPHSLLLPGDDVNDLGLV